MKQGDFKHFVASEAECFSRYQIHFAVQPLDNTGRIDLFGLEPVHDQRLVGAKGFDELLDRFQPRAHGAVAPFIQIPFGPVRTVVVPKQLKALLQQVGPDTFQIVLQHVVEFGLLFLRQILRVFQEAIFRMLQNGFVIAPVFELAHLVHPHLIDRLGQVSVGGRLKCTTPGRFKMHHLEE